MLTLMNIAFMGLLPSLMAVMGKKDANGIASVTCDRSNNGGIERNRTKRRRRLAGSNKQRKLAMAELFKLSLFL